MGAVTIPHGGLGTEKCNCEIPQHNDGSPSHTVGLEHLLKNLKIQALTLSKLKQPTERAR